MANEEQLAILKKGADTWNDWRWENPEANIDLHEADLSNVNLTGADFRGTDLSGANLSGANLIRADLGRANLIRANLSKAKLCGAKLIRTDLTGADFGRADLTGAKLIRADLAGADLSEADLSGVNLTGANLIGANLNKCILGGTTFGDVDLSQTKELETVEQLYPSTIGIDTIYKSKGNISEIFLRGCGVPDNFIAFIHSLTGKAFDFYSCFISYSTKDKEFAENIYADLQCNGVRCWFAPEDLKIGDKFRNRIDEAIHIYDKLIIVFSENSIDGTWVENEVQAAFEKEEKQKRTMLFPVRLDNEILNTDQAWATHIRRTRHIGNFTGWKAHDSYQKAFTQLLGDLQVSDTKIE
jgi:uncharacterized protein YjbI with pentapeptide repeats